jgi:hypothetical protein
MMMKELEAAFSSACSVVLGRPLKGKMDDYAQWLMRHTESVPSQRKSQLSGLPVYLSNVSFYSALKKNLVKVEEVPQLSGRKLSADEVEKLDFKNAGTLLKDVKVFSPEAKIDSTNMEECTLYGWSHYCYRTSALNKSKYCAYSFWPRQSEHIFGSKYVFSSKYLIKCFHSVSLTRCLELLDCNNCSDALFCHNCEGVSNSMFCFNAKSLRYAIGNVEVGKEKYAEIRKKVLDGMCGRLEKEKDLGISIYDLGSRRGK